MADSKKYDGSTWEHSLRKLTTATEAVENPLYSDGTAITSYTIKGNTVQNGTPTPSAPIAVQGVGELETTGEHSGEYKIPISSGQGSAVNYLGSVQTTRQIQKLVFDGSENWAVASSGDTQYYQYTIGVLNTAITGEVLCTHYEPANISSSTTVVGIRVYNSTSINISALNVRPENVTSDMNTVTKFKNWLTEQYNNGTPVTVWYVLTNATTGVVNEPLMKISDYSDSIANATAIPTVDGANTITVDTTVQPSEFTATWTGWHDASVKEWDGSDWQ